MPPGGDDHGLPDGCKREEPRPCTNIGVEIDLGSSDWRQFHTSVIKPLVDKGANTKISVSLSATHADGFDRDFIELSIREGATQINRSAKIETDTD
jgi:hypothetical protein